MVTFWPATDQNRIRFGIVSLAGGALLIAYAWGSWMYRVSVVADAPNGGGLGDASTDVDPATPALAMVKLLLIGFILVIVVLIGSYAISRAIRRHQRGLRRERSEPSDTEDVWSTHRLPDEEGYGSRDDELSV